MTLDGKTKREQRLRARIGALQSLLAQSKYGRIALHILCALIDHQLRWHAAGVRREFN